MHSTSISEEKRVYIVLVNYKTTDDTIECLESVLKTNHPNYKIAVVDNASGDGSLDKIEDWAKGEFCIVAEEPSLMSQYVNPPTTKPVPVYRLDQDEVESSSKSREEGLHKGQAEVFLIQARKNLGFAGANNLGLNLALQDPECAYIWFLNNDTVIAKSALSELVKFTKEQEDASSKMGMVGSKLLFYHQPDRFQALGARFNKWNGNDIHLAAGEKDLGQYDDAPPRVSYVIGASIFTSRHFIEAVGPMCEDYFLYHEENDWAERSKRLGWETSLCLKSVVYHKQGASTGKSPRKKKNNPVALWYKTRGHLIFYRKFYPRYMFFAYFALLLSIAKSLMKGDFESAKIEFKVLKTV